MQWSVRIKLRLFLCPLNHVIYGLNTPVHTYQLKQDTHTHTITLS